MKNDELIILLNFINFLFFYAYLRSLGICENRSLEKFSRTQPQTLLRPEGTVIKQCAQLCPPGS